MRRPRRAPAFAALLPALVQGVCSADTLLEYESPVFTKLVISHDNPAVASRLRSLDRAPGPVRVRIRVSDNAIAVSGQTGNNNYLPAGHEGIRSVEIAAEDMLFEYTNQQQRVEFQVKTYKGQVVEWQLQGSTGDGRKLVAALGPRRTTIGPGSAIEGAAACPALDIVQMPGVLTWYCGLGSWKVSRITAELALPPLSPR